MAQQSFLIPPGTSAQELAERRKLAYSMLQQGSSGAPIGHWSQGANRLAQALIGGYDLYDQSQSQKAERDEAQKLFGEVLGGGGTMTSSMPPQRAPAAQPAPQPASQAQASAAAAGRPYPPADASSVLNFIKEQEGYTPTSKWDVRQHSIGYGTKGAPGETIDRAEAERRLRAEVAPINAWIDQNVKVPVTPQQRTALTSFGYNLGVDDLQKLLPDINSGNWDRVGQRMLSFNNALNEKTGQLEPLEGLTSRRQREAALLNGGMPAGASPTPEGQPTVTQQGNPLGIDPQTAQVIQKLSGNQHTAPLAMKLLESAMKPKSPKDRYVSTKFGVFDTATQQYITPPQGSVGSEEYGTSAHYYRDPETNEIRVGQLSKSGGMKPVDVPGKVLPPFKTADLGTSTAVLGPGGSQLSEPLTKDVAGKAAQTEIGKAQGEAQVRYPQIAAQSEQMLSTIDSLLTDPYLPSMTGMVGGRQPNMTEDAIRVQTKIDQLQNQVFLEGYERLKGGGVITDYEGKKAEGAIARIQDPRVRYADYVAAVKELRDIVERGSRRAREAAGVDGTGSPTPTTNVDALKQKYGLE